LNTLYEKRIGLNKMLSNKEEYVDCMSARGENFSTEVLFMILIFEQQKMINELMTRLAEEKIRGLSLIEFVCPFFYI
jgi:hypothetical protein